MRNDDRNENRLENRNDEKKDDRDTNCMRSGSEKEDLTAQFMRALTDLPDDMILEAAWKEDEGAAGKGRRRFIPILISAAAALVIGFISWGIFSERQRVVKEESTEVETVTDAVINTEKSSEETDTGKSSEDIGKENEPGAHTSSDVSTVVPSNGDSEDKQRTENTEPKLTETTEKTESTENIDNSETGKDTSKVNKPEKSNYGREEKNKGNKKEKPKKKETQKDETDKDETDKDETDKDEIQKDETNIEKEKTAKDKYEAENRILNYVDPDYRLMTDQTYGYIDLPDTFGGTSNDRGDGLLHVYATTEEALEEYKEVLSEYSIVVYHNVDHSYYELREIEAMIREHQSEFRFLKTSIDIACNKVVVEVEADDYERMQELVQGQPVFVRIHGIDEQSLQEASEMQGMDDDSEHNE